MYSRILSYVQIMNVPRSCESVAGSFKGTCKIFKDICFVSSLKNIEVSRSNEYMYMFVCKSWIENHNSL